MSPRYTAIHIKMRADIAAYLAEHGPATLKQICAALNIKRYTAYARVSELVADGQAHCKWLLATHQGGRTAIFHEGPAPDGEAEVEQDNFARKVVVRKEWESYNRRMAMDCYLFGAPGHEVRA